MKFLKLTAFVLLAATTVGCKTLKKDFLHPDQDAPKQNAPSPYAQIVAGEATGNSAQNVTAVFPPVKVTAFYSQKPNCQPIGTATTIDQLNTPDPLRHWPYAVVTVTGLNVNVQFLGITPGQDYCYAIKTDPNVQASGLDLY